MEKISTQNLAYEEWEVMSFFYGLTIAYHLEYLTSDEFIEALRSLIFIDEHGTIWSIGSVSGNWYFRDEDNWIMGEPNTLLYQVEKAEEYTVNSRLDLRNPILKELLKKM